MLPTSTTVRSCGNYLWSTNENRGISFLLINLDTGKPVGINNVKIQFFKNVKNKTLTQILNNTGQRLINGHLTGAVN